MFDPLDEDKKKKKKKKENVTLNDPLLILANIRYNDIFLTKMIQMK